MANGSSATIDVLLVASTTGKVMAAIDVGPDVTYSVAPASPAAFVGGISWDDGALTLSLPFVAALLNVNNTTNADDLIIACGGGSATVAANSAALIFSDGSGTVSLVAAPLGSAAGLPSTDPAVANAIYIDTDTTPHSLVVSAGP